MQFPYRIKIMFSKSSQKLKVIQYVNAFMLNSVKEKYAKWNVERSGEFLGIELAFADRADAIHFRLGFNIDDEKISCQNFS